MRELFPFPSQQELDEELVPALQLAVRRSTDTVVALFTLHVSTGDAVQQATEEAIDTLATLDSIGGTVAVEAALLDAERALCGQGSQSRVAVTTWMSRLASTVQEWRD
jgi:hypothetical protein